MEGEGGVKAMGEVEARYNNDDDEERRRRGV
jgi:hypothetical protein